VIRRRRPGRTSPAAADGDLVIDGRIRARVLGLPLLDLDAHVVVGPARVRPTASASPRQVTPPARGRANTLPPTPRAALVDGTGADGSRPSALGRAVRLLGEGSTALDDARRIRRQALTAPAAQRRSG
jgi:hypothetical protein